MSTTHITILIVTFISVFFEMKFSTAWLKAPYINLQGKLCGTTAGNLGGLLHYNKFASLTFSLLLSVLINFFFGASGIIILIASLLSTVITDAIYYPILKFFAEKKVKSIQEGKTKEIKSKVDYLARYIILKSKDQRQIEKVNNLLPRLGGQPTEKEPYWTRDNYGLDPVQ